jgi:hypothetical protein
MLSLPEIASDHNSKREIDFPLYEEQRLQNQINVTKLFGEYRALKEDLKLVHVYSNGNRYMVMIVMTMVIVMMMIVMTMMMTEMMMMLLLLMMMMMMSAPYLSTCLYMYY